jgi:hypothetical protein
MQKKLNFDNSRNPEKKNIKSSNIFPDLNHSSIGDQSYAIPKLIYGDNKIIKDPNHKWNHKQTEIKMPRGSEGGHNIYLPP